MCGVVDDKPIAEQPEGFLVFASEHGVMDARHQRRVIGQCRRQWYALFAEVVGGVAKVELVEHAVLPVACQDWQVFVLEQAPLTEKPAQIGLI